MRRFMRFAPLIMLFAVGCSTTLQSLVADEKAGATYCAQIQTLAKAKAAPTVILAANDKMLALDPSSPTLQKVHSAVAQAVAAGDLTAVAIVAGDAAAVLNDLAAVTSAL
jgi:hypothetical protein